MKAIISPALAEKIRRNAQCYLGTADLITDDPIAYETECECYSEYTAIPARIEIPLRTHRANPPISMIDHLWDNIKSIQHDVPIYLAKELPWTGCECCGNQLEVDVRLYPRPWEKK